MKSFSEIVNDDVRGLASQADALMLRNDECFNWKLELRAILGSLVSTRAKHLRDLIEVKIKFLDEEVSEQELLEAQAKFLDWVSKTAWFESKVKNNFEEASLIVSDQNNYCDPVDSALNEISNELGFVAGGFDA